MPRFFIKPLDIQQGTSVLSAEESRHALSVLRLKVGDTVEVFDGEGRSFQAVISDTAKGRVTLLIRLNSVKNQKAADDEVALAVSVIKPERMELLIQKATELGVHSVFPLLTARSIVRISKERWVSKTERWRKIALESCKQCGRSRAPRIEEVQSLQSFLKTDASRYGLVLIPTLAKAGQGLYDRLRHDTSRKVVVLIGPEGDFTAEEADAAIACGAKPIDLGSLILRSETAAIYALSAIRFVLREVRREG